MSEFEIHWAGKSIDGLRPKCPTHGCNHEHLPRGDQGYGVKKSTFTHWPQALDRNDHPWVVASLAVRVLNSSLKGRQWFCLNQNVKGNSGNTKRQGRF